MLEQSEVTMEKIVSLCKRRGFIFPGSEIYGGLAGTWDYGPYGVELKNNIKQLWWKMFVQGRDALHRPASGLGVGLALARSIVELHHGTLEAKSEGSGKGAQFVICLPMIANRPGVDSRGAKKSGDEPAHHDEGRGAQRIMVVDDNADAAAMLASLLHNHGHDVRVAVDGRKALEMAREFAPHVVLLDIGMPGMNGLEVARRLRQQNQEPRPLIAAVTGWSGPTEAERSLEAGFDVHLVKPVEEADLLKLLDMGLRPFAGPGGKTVRA